MDAITQAIREQYELYPYPAGEPVQRVGTDARLLLNYGQTPRADGSKPIQVLDAGCGRGVGLIGCATLQPDVQFTGIDINRTALKEVQEQVAARNLQNVTIQEVNLMTLEGLEVPEGGFDVIYSSGVLHHLSDPVLGLEKLKSVLAPHGVISLMVYATFGRQPLYRLINATKILVPDGSFEEQIPPTRELAEFCKDTVLKETPWDHVPGTNDVEFVDLCLNANEVSYSVETMWDLLAKTQMRFLRWSIPSQWSTDILPEGTLRELALKLDDYNRYKLIEQISWLPSLELVIGHVENEPRETFDANAINNNAYAVNPEISFILESKNHRSGKRPESLMFKRPSDEEPVICADINQLIGLSIVSEQTEPFTGDAFVEVMAQDGVPREPAIKVLEYLLDQEVLFRPHLTDL